jgi:hypothetical protein
MMTELCCAEPMQVHASIYCRPSLLKSAGSAEVSKLSLFLALFPFLCV